MLSLSSPLSSQNATHRTGLEISALDISPNGTRAILAGREILKTILVDGTKCAEEFNLLSAMRQYASHNAGRGRPKDALDIHDVKWSHNAYDTLVATAASSGRVVLYDMNRPGVELARLHEHPRQVHKVAFNPHHGALLLSGSQDGTTKLWDMRDLKRAVGICPSQYTHNGQSDGVRDVKWSPVDGVEFAFGTDSGIVQRWDYRQPKAPKLKINAHNRTCHAIDWHPDGTHLVSAGSDRTLRVWNFASDARRQKPAWTLQAPYPVHHVRWRPPCRSSETQDDRAWQSTHLVTSYDRDHSAVHVWDFRRPNIPFRELLHYNAAPTDLLWHSQDLLWTVGREGVFNQTDIKFAPKPTERRNPQAFAMASHGELTCVSGEIPWRKTPSSERRVPENIQDSHTPKGPSPEKASLGRNSMDDSIDEGFLSSSFKKRHARSGSNRSIKSLSNTPPSYDDVAKIKPLDETLPRDEAISPNQIAARCLTATGISSPLLFTLLAHKYITSLPEGSGAPLSPTGIAKTLEENFLHAKRAGLHRIAQSFKILHRLLMHPPAPLTIGTHLLHGKSPLDLAPPHSLPVTGNQNGLSATDRSADAAPEKTVPTESSSNVATPLARPRSDGISAASATEFFPLEPEKDAALVLPPSLIEPTPSNSHLSERSNSVTADYPQSKFDGAKWTDTKDFDERRRQMTTWQAPPKATLNLGLPTQSQGMYTQPLPLDRHDSNESFPMFSASTDSHRNSIPSSSSSARSQDPRHTRSHQDSEMAVDSSTQSRNNSNEFLQAPGSLHLAEGESFPPSGLSISRIAGDSVRTGTNSSDVADSEKHSPGLLSTVTSMSSSPEELRRPLAHSRTTLSNKDGLERRQNVTFAPDSAKDSDSNNNSLTSAAGNNSLRAAKQQSSSKESQSSDYFPSRVVSNSKPLSQAPTVGSQHNLPSIAGLVLPQLMAYHTNQCPDAQTAAHSLLLLTPLLLENPSPSSHLQSLVQQADPSNDQSSGQDRTVTSIYQEKLSQLGISPFQMESIMVTYHDQLVSLRLFNTATHLRRLCFPLYPGVYEQFQGLAQIRLLCQFCKNPINSLSWDNRCGSCRSRQSSCPICWSDRSPFEDFSATKDRSRRRGRGRSTSVASERHSSEATKSAPSSRPSAWLAKTFAAHFSTRASAASSRPSLPVRTSSAQLKSSKEGNNNVAACSKLYTTCTLCNHASHASCQRVWLMRVADGGCATPGCLCDCARGTWRDAKVATRGQGGGRSEVAAVRGDRWGVKESKAVAMVRSTLGAGGSGRGEEGRRVRVVEPGAD